MAYSDKKNLLELVALMDAFGVHHVVLSPGSRNAPLIHTFMLHPAFQCYTIVDERSAGFFALGMAQRLRQPVAVCCTSGTALLNYSPAVAEAFYQEVPLLVLSADRPAAWIGQADGQTLPQPNAFGTLVKKSVQLPEINTDEELWYCNRLINEALIALTQNGFGPVHINIPLSEPLYQFTEDALPKARVIKMEKCISMIDMQSFATKWECYPKRMIVVGQLPPDHGLHEVLAQLAQQNDVVILAEHLANLPLSKVTGHFDAVLSSMSAEEQAAFVPDLVITVGGHITSKRVKQFLRKHTIREQWDIRPNGHVVDTYQSLTAVVPVEADWFFRLLSECIDSKPAFHDYASQWEERSLQIEHQLQNYVSKQPFSDLKAVAAFMHGLPDHSTLHLSNSSPLRYAQLFALKPSIDVFSNRGTNGIDGVLSTAVGHAAENQKLTFLLIGDLSFFYDINGLWNRYISPRLRIVLINNGGGNLFHLIGGPKNSFTLDESIAYKHSTTAKERATTLGFRYLSATTEQDYVDQLPLLWEVEETQAMILEVFTQTEINSIVFNSLYQSFKTHVQ